MTMASMHDRVAISPTVAIWLQSGSRIGAIPRGPISTIMATWGVARQAAGRKTCKRQGRLRRRRTAHGRGLPSAQKQVAGGLGLMPGGGYRAGEANNPGPRSRHRVTAVLTANVTGWGNVPQVLATTTADVVLLQEHRQRGREQRIRSAAAAKREGWNVALEDASPTERDTSGGLGCAARQGVPMARLPREDTLHGARWAPYRIPGKSAGDITLISIWGYIGEGPRPGTKHCSPKWRVS